MPKRLKKYISNYCQREQRLIAMHHKYLRIVDEYDKDQNNPTSLL